FGGWPWPASYRAEPETSLGHRLDAGGHRTFTRVQVRVFAVGVDLIALQLRVLAGCGEHNGTAAAVDFHSNLKSLLDRVTKKLLHHGHDVLGRVLLVVPQDDVVARLPLGLLGL